MNLLEIYVIGYVAIVAFLVVTKRFKDESRVPILIGACHWPLFLIMAILALIACIIEYTRIHYLQNMEQDHPEL